MKLRLTVKFLIASLALPLAGSAATLLPAGVGYGISATNSNSFAFDFTGDPNWGAGSQRSANGSVDPNNRRAGRLFLEFQVTQEFIDLLVIPGATVNLGFSVDAIGAGVTGTPYTDGLDLRYLGSAAGDRTVSTLWNTAGQWEQGDILATSGPTGANSVTLSSALGSLTAGQWIAFGLSNSVGYQASYPVGNSFAETYSFGMNHTSNNYSLTVIPEPSVGVPGGIALLGLMRRRRTV